MTWTINISGHDDLSDDAKRVYENKVVEIALKMAYAIKVLDLDFGHVSTATCYTNTTGQVNLLEKISS
jgi:hypothetical protein